MAQYGICRRLGLCGVALAAAIAATGWDSTGAGEAPGADAVRAAEMRAEARRERALEMRRAEASETDAGRAAFLGVLMALRNGGAVGVAQ